MLDSTEMILFCLPSPPPTSKNNPVQVPTFLSVEMMQILLDSFKADCILEEFPVR